MAALAAVLRPRRVVGQVDGAVVQDAVGRFGLVDDQVCAARRPEARAAVDLEGAFVRRRRVVVLAQFPALDLEGRAGGVREVRLQVVDVGALRRLGVDDALVDERGTVADDRGRGARGRLVEHERPVVDDFCAGEPDVGLMAGFRFGGHRLPGGDRPAQLGAVDEVEAAAAAHVGEHAGVADEHRAARLGRRARFLRPRRVVREIDRAAVGERPLVDDQVCAARRPEARPAFDLEAAFVRGLRVVVLSQFAGLDFEGRTRSVRQVRLQVVGAACRREHFTATGDRRRRRRHNGRRGARPAFQVENSRLADRAVGRKAERSRGQGAAHDQRLPRRARGGAQVQRLDRRAAGQGHAVGPGCCDADFVARRRHRAGRPSCGHAPRAAFGFGPRVGAARARPGGRRAGQAQCEGNRERAKKKRDPPGSRGESFDMGPRG